MKAGNESDGKGRNYTLSQWSAQIRESANQLQRSIILRFPLLQPLSLTLSSSSFDPSFQLEAFCRRMPFLVFLLLSLLFLWLYLERRRASLPPVLPHVPRANGLPFFGPVLSFFHNPRVFLDNQRKKVCVSLLISYFFLLHFFLRSSFLFYLSISHVAFFRTIFCTARRHL